MRADEPTGVGVGVGSKTSKSARADGLNVLCARSFCLFFDCTTNFMKIRLFEDLRTNKYFFKELVDILSLWFE